MHIERNFSFISLTKLICHTPSFRRLPKWQTMPSFRKCVISCLLCLPWFSSPPDWVYFLSGEYASLLEWQSHSFYVSWEFHSKHLVRGLKVAGEDLRNSLISPSRRKLHSLLVFHMMVRKGWGFPRFWSPRMLLVIGDTRVWQKNLICRGLNEGRKGGAATVCVLGTSSRGSQKAVPGPAAATVPGNVLGTHICWA